MHASAPSSTTNSIDAQHRAQFLSLSDLNMLSRWAFGLLFLLDACLRLSGSPTPFLASVSSKEEALAAFEFYTSPRNVTTKSALGGLRGLYEQWKSHFDVSYSPQEDARRFEIFSETVAQVMADNADPAIQHWSGLNEFSAMTWEEFAAATLAPSLNDLSTDGKSSSNGGGSSSDQEQQEQVLGANGTVRVKSAELASFAVPEDVDWWAAGKVSPVKKQEKCQACWAFAAAAVLESAVLIQSGRTYAEYPIDLSEQQLTDCVNEKFDPTFLSRGCGMGITYEALNYAARQYVVPERRYRWKSGRSGRVGACKKGRIASTPASERVQVSDGGWDLVGTFSHTDLAKAVARQPVAVNFEVTPSFKNYWGGVYTATDCGKTVNHAMAVVGYRRTAADGPQWIFKNSWGTRWGDGGFAYVRMTQGLFDDGPCGMYRYPLATPTLLVSAPARAKRRS